MSFKVIIVYLGLFLFLITTSCFAQQIIPIYNSKELKNNTLKIYSDSGNIAITAYQPNLIKVSLSKNKELQLNSAATTKPLNIRVTQNLESVFFTTDSLIIVIDKYDLGIKLMTRKEHLLTQSNSFFVNNPEQLLSFNLQKEERILGIKRNKRESRRLKNKSIFKSSNGYLLQIESCRNSKLISRDQTLAFRLEKETIQYLFYQGSIFKIPNQFLINTTNCKN